MNWTTEQAEIEFDSQVAALAGTVENVSILVPLADICDGNLAPSHIEFLTQCYEKLAHWQRRFFWTRTHSNLERIAYLLQYGACVLEG